MLRSMQATLRSRGVFGLWDGLSGTLLRQMTYSLARFGTYERFKANMRA